MGNRVKGRPRSRPKPKSVKAKINRQMGSKRRTQRMGKELKKGQKGAAASFLTRAQVLRRLQISLRDFRRLCILKGVYPRDPSKKVSGKDKTYYHIKDVGFLAHEPILQSFRDFKAFMRKLRRAISRKGLQDAQRRELNERPVYKLDHLVKERYPRFLDAVRDLDDALSLVHLFASLPQMKKRTSAHTETCKRLVKEWTYYVSRAKCLSKVFVSIKGVYFQAEILGLPVTWIVPHMFTNHYPRDVDFSIMLTFLEFYETFLKFVMFKLFHTLDLRYPPVLDVKLEGVDAGLSVVKVQTVDGDGGDDSRPDGLEEEEEKHRVLPTTREERRVAKKKVRVEEKKLQSLEAKLAKIARADKAAAEAEAAASTVDEGANMEDKEKGGDGDGEDDAEMGEAFTIPLAEAFRKRGDDEENGDEEEEAFGGEGEGDGEEARRKRLFKGLRFFLGREVPKSWMEFVVMSCGGTVGWEGEGSPFTSADPSITHQVVDRPTTTKPRRKRREYVQPQWVLDSLNARMLLPVARYAPGAMLPPHLSPFVDDDTEGYVPAYREELDRLRSAAEARRNREAVPGEDDGDSDTARNTPVEKGDEDGNPEEAFVRDLERERAGTSFSNSKEEGQKQQEEVEEDEEEGEEVGESESSEEREQDKPQQTEEEEHHELSKTMMSKKAKRLYGRMQYGLNKRRDEVEKLKVKRRMLEAKYDATLDMAKSNSNSSNSSEKRRKQSKKNKGFEVKKLENE